MLERLNQIIVAVSSAPGRGAMGIVRLGGPGCIELAERFFHAVDRPPGESRGGTRQVGEVVVDETLRFPGASLAFRGPHSYTRQDLIEIQTLGSPVALELVRRCAIAHGALPALPGEFTARAFLLGAMDLGQAEGVAAVIRSQSDTQLRAARRMMDGALHARIATVRDELAELLALVEADIDFAEEPIEFITPHDLRGRLARVAAGLAALLAGSTTQEQLDGLPRILLLGSPNAGKSTLMNVLSGIPRAICAAVAGTTRDLLAAPISLGCGEAVLLDAAGVDESSDPIVEAARCMTLAAAGRVDLVCWVVDATSAEQRLLPTVRSFSESPIVVALNKKDVLASEVLAVKVREVESWGLGPVRGISALRGTGITELVAEFRAILGTASGTTAAESVALTERQRSAVAQGIQSIERAGAVAVSVGETVDCADVAAFELREALEVLGTVTGAVSTDDLLGRVFERFCIGK
jgi:tRNA modification GTPase